MDVKDFEKKIAHLDQSMVLTIAVDVINELLIKRGIATDVEMQDMFLEYMRLAKKRQAERE